MRASSLSWRRFYPFGLFVQNLGKIIKNAKLDPDIERLISQAYGFASNKDFVRHGGTGESAIRKEEAEFFLEFAAISIIYIVAKLKKPSGGL